jgi:hypothetical protein
MVLKQGEKVHVIIRREFEADLRRHFIGEIKEAGDSVVRVEGYAFLYDPRSAQYVRKPELRVRVVSLMDARNIVNVIPKSTKIDKVIYSTASDGNMVVTDEGDFNLEISEFGPRY